jgi:hypothetical protein
MLWVNFIATALLRIRAQKPEMIPLTANSGTFLVTRRGALAGKVRNRPETEKTLA